MAPAHLALALASALAATALQGCGGTGKSSAPVPTTNVTMAKSYRFAPPAITVAAGATVTWTNDDNFTHTVRVDGQADHRVDRGKSVSITFATPGTYHYVCTLHRRDMQGEVIVQ